VQTRVATKAVQRQVSENRGTEVNHAQHVIAASARELQRRASMQYCKSDTKSNILTSFSFLATRDAENFLYLTAIILCFNLTAMLCECEKGLR
jgi:hypothetical protein